MIDIDELKQAIERRNVQKIASIIKQYSLKIVDGKIIADKDVVNEYEAFWDRAQHSQKILLNSLYGAIGNVASKWFDERIAQSTTLTGRCIVRHMASKINEVVDGKYDHKGLSIIYGDTDSVDKDSIVETNTGNTRIEDLFISGSIFWQEGDKEYSRNDSIRVLGYDPNTHDTMLLPYNYVYRHRVSKKKFKITTASGKTVIVTEDHSVMVVDNGTLMGKKPTELKNDIIVTVAGLQRMVRKLDTIESVEELEPFNDEYVYDIGINLDQPWFFANGILVHNSAYFSAYPVMKNLEEFKDFEWSKENVANLYDNIADVTNASFPEFMKTAFNVPEERGEVIKAGRELCATKGLFITKKRYAVMVYDKEGKRKDVDGKPGEIKVMGIDIKRADSIQKVKDFLYEILGDVLTDIQKEEIFTKIKEFREEFRKWPSWAKGSPKRVNNLTMYANVKKSMETADVYGKHSIKKKTIPGHVLASLNYMKLKDIHYDNESLPIQDGSKVIVCKLKSNPLGMTSVAYPIDQLIIPDWFKQLPFDDETMEQIALDKKLENMLGVLKWDLEKTKKDSQSFSDLFQF